MAHYHSVSATFIPGSLDDDYQMPQYRPEVVAPEPQRYEVPAMLHDHKRLRG